MKTIKNKNLMTRRHFLGTTVASAAAFTIVPGNVISGLGHQVPSDTLNVAGIGIGGQGRGDLRGIARAANIVALCDVDWKYSNKTFVDYPNAMKYWDWRKMFDEKGKDIDAVLVATADHSHAIISATAITLGKHVYCEKPLTHSVSESRLITQLTEKYRVATQMGNQGSSSNDIRLVCEWIWNGEIGDVKEVHAWTNRPIWPQGLQRPEVEMKVPETLNWDLFIGSAPMRPYNEIYTPWNWRGWWDFGTGAFGDMACHILDPVFRALKLKYPTVVQGNSTTLNTESAPNAQVVHFEFPARPNEPLVNMPAVKVTWYDGGLMPERPDGMPDGFALGDWNGGVMFVGTKDILVTNCYSAKPRLVSGRVPSVPPTLPRLAQGLNHQTDWVRACKESPDNRVQASSHFGHAGPFNEMVVMGVLAVRLQDLKRKLLWDGENMQFTNISDTDKISVITSNNFTVVDGDPKFNTKYAASNAKQAAGEYIRHTYREGWALPKL
jgi:predicted dehydrogenase